MKQTQRQIEILKKSQILLAVQVNGDDGEDANGHTDNAGYHVMSSSYVHTFAAATWLVFEFISLETSEERRFKLLSVLFFACAFSGFSAEQY